MDGISLVFALLSGAIGGWFGGKLVKSGLRNFPLIIMGIVGGTGLASVLQYLPGLNGLMTNVSADGLNILGLLIAIISGAIGGLILSIILSKIMGRKI